MHYDEDRQQREDSLEEVLEDIELMGGMIPSEKTYLSSSAWELFKNRIPWLLLLMVSATFTGMIITAFESALAAQVALTAFIPMLMGTGGNSGSQSSVTVIRALSLDELKFSDLSKVLWKELGTSLLCGVTLSVVCFLKIWLVDRMLLDNTQITLMVDAVVCLALLVTVVAAKFVGAALPMLAKKVKLADLKHNLDLTRLDKITEKDLIRNEKYKKAIKYLFE